MKKLLKKIDWEKFALRFFLLLESLNAKLFRQYQQFLNDSPYVRLMRLDKPTGYILLALPALWTVIIASQNIFELSLFLLLFTLGAVIMRSAGCIINDIVDRKIDAGVERTAPRPIASGEITVKDASKLLFALLSCALGILMILPKIVIYIGLIAIIPIAMYPLMKRVTFFPQVFLGFTFNFGVFMAWLSISEMKSFVPFLLYIGSVLWTIGYDTIYAHQDKEGDKKTGVKSMALKFPENSKEIIKKLYHMAFLCILIAGVNVHMNFTFYVFMCIAGIQLYMQIKNVNLDDPEDCAKAFRSNTQFGFLVFIGMLFGKL